MKAQELRIGNYVKDRGCKVIRIDFMEYQEDGYSTKFGQRMFLGEEEVHPMTEYTDYAIPIKLTEEWLLKFGFERKDRGSVSAQFHIGINPITHDWLFDVVWLKSIKDYSLEDFPFYMNGRFKIKYVHTLQNLYFALTGEELTINDI